MPIPKFHETFIPILELLSDGGSIRRADMAMKLQESGKFVLTPEEEKMETPTGYNLYSNRVGWGVSYLRQGRFIEFPERGNIKATAKGLELIKSRKSLTLSELRHDPDFEAYRKKTSIPREGENVIEQSNVTPQDMIDAGFSEIRDSLKSDLLEKLKAINPYYFEVVILVLFQKMGYGDFTRTSKSNDGGVDGIINQDKLGVEKIYTQAKRYNDHQVGARDMTNFIGAISRDGVNKGIFVTTSTFSPSAVQIAERARDTIILIDGERLVDLMIDFNVGVQIKTTYEIKQVDEDFFEEN